MIMEFREFKTTKSFNLFIKNIKLYYLVFRLRFDHGETHVLEVFGNSYKVLATIRQYLYNFEYPNDFVIKYWIKINNAQIMFLLRIVLMWFFSFFNFKKMINKSYFESKGLNVEV